MSVLVMRKGGKFNIHRGRQAAAATLLFIIIGEYDMCGCVNILLMTVSYGSPSAKH